MRNLSWLRYGIASLIVVGAGASVLIACGDDDPETGVVAKPDSGGNTDAGTTDSSVETDGSLDADSGPAAVPAKLTIVNASVSLGPNGDLGENTAMRLCFARGKTEAVTDGVAPYPPLPHKVAGSAPIPGLFAATGGAFPSLGVNLEPLYIKPYIMNAKSLALKGIVGQGIGKTCDEILPRPGVDAGTDSGADAAAALVKNVDYWELPTIPANTFKSDKSFVLVLTGCAGDTDNAKLANCGPDAPGPDGDPGVGNLKVSIYEVDRTTKIDGDSMGVQFIHASSPWLDSPEIEIKPALLESDGGGVADLSGGNDVQYLGKTDLVQVKGLKAKISPNPLVSEFAFPLDKVKLLSGLADDYALGKAYTFLLVGDIRIPVAGDGDGGAPRLQGYHFLGFENDPTIKAFEP